MKFPFLVIILLLSIANAFANDLDFTLVNQTGRSFEGLYITSTDNKDWDANLLINGEVLVAGGKIRVRFKRDAKSPTWDFNLVDNEGLSVTFSKVRLTGVDTVTPGAVSLNTVESRWLRVENEAQCHQRWLSSSR
jgi:hypothetical protein